MKLSIESAIEPARLNNGSSFVQMLCFDLCAYWNTSFLMVVLDLQTSSYPTLDFAMKLSRCTFEQPEMVKYVAVSIMLPLEIFYSI